MGFLLFLSELIHFSVEISNMVNVDLIEPI